MPQLDPSSYASQLFWLTVSFIVLYVLLARALLPRIQSVQSARADAIGGDEQQAARMKADAEMAREHYEKALAQARARSLAMLAETQGDIAGRAQKRQAELDAEIEKKLAEAQKQIAAATKDVRAKLASVASDLTSAIAQAIAQVKPDASKVGALVDSVIKKREG